MSRLNFRENTLLYDTNSEPDWGSAYRAIALPIGATVSASSSGTTATVHQGHGFIAGQKFCTIASNAVVLYGTVTARTATTLTLNTSFTLSVGDILINLGADTGSSAPNFDGSPIDIWTTSDKTTLATDSTVTADSVGKYRYWHQGFNFWELILDSSLDPVDIIPGIGLCAIAGGVNAVDFGAKPHDVTYDSGPAIQAAVNSIAVTTAHPTSGAAAPMGGTVWLPVDDDGAYGIGTAVNRGYGVEIEGLGGWARSVCITTGLNYMYGVDSHNGVLGARNAGMRRMMIDGAGEAEIGLYVGLAVLNTFQDIRVQFCTDAGMVVDAAQNNVFINCDLSQNGAQASTDGCGLRLENGAGNNKFFMGGCRNNVPHNLRVREMATQSGYASYFYGNGSSGGGVGPHANTFFGTIFEELDEATCTANVLFTAGFDNRFEACSFPLSGIDLPDIQMRNTDASATVDDTNRTGFFGCTFNGLNAAAQIEDANNTQFQDCIFQNFSKIIDWGTLAPSQSEAENKVIWGPGNIIVGTITDYWDVGATGFTLELCFSSGQSRGVMDFFPDTGSSTAIRVGADVNGPPATTNWRIRGGGKMLWGTSSDATLDRGAAGCLKVEEIVAVGASAGLTASTTQTQAGGLALTKGVNEITTAAVSGDAVTLPTAVAGMQIVVINAAAANAIQVFPAVGGTINNESANASISLPADDMAIFIATSTTQWHAFVDDRV